jgi:hypothetical protein
MAEIRHIYVHCVYLTGKAGYIPSALHLRYAFTVWILRGGVSIHAPLPFKIDTPYTLTLCIRLLQGEVAQVEAMLVDPTGKNEAEAMGGKLYLSLQLQLLSQ